MHFTQGLHDWARGFATIREEKHGIEQYFGLLLYALTLISLPQWWHVCFGKAGDKSVDTCTEWFVVVALVISILIFFFSPAYLPDY